MSKRFAEQFFGSENPIGAIIESSGREYIVADVCENAGICTEMPSISDIMIPCNNLYSDEYYDSTAYSAVLLLREGADCEALAKEAASRLCRPREQVCIEKISDFGLDTYYNFHIILRLAGFLILMASAIGFLRMQIQLFWMRKRELALRAANGAKRMQMFCMLIVEPSIMIIISALISAWLGALLQGSDFASWLEGTFMMPFFGHQAYYCACICLGLIAACAAIIYVAVMRICNSNSGLQMQMRHSNSHVFRNIMLSVQTFISMVLVAIVSGFLYMVITWASQHNIPEDASLYQDAVEIRNQKSEALYSEIASLPETRYIFKRRRYFAPESEMGLDTSGRGDSYIGISYLADTFAVDFIARDACYNRSAIDDGKSCILSQQLYERCLREGAIKDGAIALGHSWAYDEQADTWNQGEVITKKVAGTYKGIVYNYVANPDDMIVFGNPEGGHAEEWIVVAHQGQKMQLMGKMEDLLLEMESQAGSECIKGFTYRVEQEEAFSTSMFIGLSMLSLTSLMLCISGIYSTVALDTRSRRKEMAIRKINGAKARDIAMLFVKSYIWILIPSLILSALVSAVVLREIDWAAQILAPILAGIGISTLSIVLAIMVHIRLVMRVDLSEIIAKE